MSPTVANTGSRVIALYSHSGDTLMATPLAFPGQSTDTPAQITIDMAGTPMVAEHRTFSSGSTGYYASGKVFIGGRKHQVSCSVVLVGSKPQQSELKPTTSAAVKPAK